ncbi:hypothetical protein N2152v2_005672 [Parachlorella kessleri]
MPLQGTGYTQWMRERRAQGDKVPFLCYLGFLVATLVKHGTTLPTPYLLYFLTMTAVLACLLAWQHSGRASYLPWRDWVHFVLRLEAFYSPAQLYLAQRTWASDSAASSLTILPIILLTSGTVQLFVLSFIHYVNLPSQLVLQSLCAARAAVAAGLELRSYRAFCHSQQQPQIADREHSMSAHGAADRLLDRVNALVVPLLAALATSPTVYLLLAVGLWDASSWLLL